MKVDRCWKQIVNKLKGWYQSVSSVLANQTRQIIETVKKNNASNKDSSFLEYAKNILLALKSYLSKICKQQYQALLHKLKQYAWFIQLDEASRYHVRLTTFISSFFINILSLAFPLSLMQVYDRVIPNRSYSTLTFLFIGVGIAILLEMLLKVSRSYINLWGDTKYEYELSNKALNNLMHVPLYVYEKTDVGTRIKQFAILDQLRGFYNNQLLISISDIPFLFIFIIVIAYIGKWLAIVPIILGVGLLGLSFNYVNKWRTFLSEKLMQESKESDFLVNVLGGIHTTKSLGIENLLIRRYERIQDTSDKINFDSSVQQGDLTTLKAAVSQVNIILMGSFGAISVMAGNIAVGSLIACILLSGRFMQPLIKLVSAFSRWKMINIIRNQLDTVLKMPITAEMDSIPLAGKISLKKISYLYKDKDHIHWILQDVNLNIEPLTVVSIVGGTQEQKEILLNILATITRPTDGEYRIDNKDIDEFKNFNLRSQIAYISKVGNLFYGSIMDNLSAFDETLIPDAKKFSKKLGLDSIISKLPSGYDTMVGDKTVEALPGGVINLIFIIRALVNKPKIILFDEPNMNLDVRSTKNLVELLQALKHDATIIIISKTKETFEFSDVVYEVKDMKLKRVS